MLLLWKYFALSFTALLPLVNPLGSALIFLGLVGSAPISVYHALARKIAINTIIFFVVIELVGATTLRFFGISLPIVQVSGGLVIAAIGWGILSQKDTDPSSEKMQAAAVQAQVKDVEGTLLQKAFYPFTFPITVGPGCIVVMLTVTAHLPQKTVTDFVLTHLAVLIAAVALAATVYFCYAYAPRISRRISPSTAHGIQQVMAFILLCIGVQIAWNGLAPLLTHVFFPT
jgi:multiple antibiotic resistance protein